MIDAVSSVETHEHINGEFQGLGQGPWAKGFEQMENLAHFSHISYNILANSRKHVKRDTDFDECSTTNMYRNSRTQKLANKHIANLCGLLSTSPKGWAAKRFVY